MNSLSQMWQFASTHVMLSVAIVGLVLIGVTGLVCLVYGIRLQRLLKGKRKPTSKQGAGRL